MKQPRHRKYQRMPPEEMIIDPEEYYTIAQASSFLGKSRMSIYRYLTSRSSSICSQRIPGHFRQVIKGADLIAFKAEGLPKLGRRRHPLSEREKKVNSNRREENSNDSALSGKDTSG